MLSRCSIQIYPKKQSWLFVGVSHPTEKIWIPGIKNPRVIPKVKNPRIPEIHPGNFAISGGKNFEITKNSGSRGLKSGDSKNPVSREFAKNPEKIPMIRKPNNPNFFKGFSNLNYKQMPFQNEKIPMAGSRNNPIPKPTFYENHNHEFSRKITKIVIY